MNHSDLSSISNEYLNRAALYLIITTLAYFLINGAQLFETIVFVPEWTSKPPFSLSALQGPYSPDLKTFWIVAHSIHELTFIAAIIFCWQLPQIRLTLIVIFVLHFIVRVWTIGYFAPNIMAFQKADTSLVSPEIQAAVKRWRNLNYVRVAAFVILSIWTVVVAAKVWRISLQN
ncbi:MAG: transposase [Ferruginibacter sp.]